MHRLDRLSLCVVLALFTQAGAVAGQDACTLRIGVQETLDPVFFVESMGPAMAHLRKAMPECRFQTELLSVSGLTKSASRKEIDLFMADSGIFAYLESREGAKSLAVRTQPKGTDPSRAVSSTVIVRADRADLRSIEDLQGKTVAAVDSSSFDGWLIAEALISREGYDPERFWRKRLFTSYRNPDVAELVLTGEADVGILRACELEGLLLGQDNGAEPFRVINPQRGGSLACLRSAPLYPDVVFASLPHADPKALKRITLVLLGSEPSYGGFAWGVAGDFRGVDELYRTLKRGPYSYLRVFNWTVFLEKYRTLLILCALLVVAVVVHIVRTNRLVFVRSQQLRNALAREERLELEARETRLRMSQIERSGVVSQMSGMLAHEVLQPVASLMNYAGGLRMYVAAKFGDDPTVTAAADAITEEAERVSQIVGRVRAYAKGRASQRVRTSVLEAVNNAVRTFRHSTTSENVQIRIHVPEDLVFIVNRLEIELVLYNLLQNGAAAMEREDEKLLDIFARIKGSDIELSVRDWGPPVPDEVFERLAVPVTSLKADGLGLGLTLCKSILEHHGGRLEFIRKSRGLQATVILAAEQGEQAGRSNGASAQGEHS